MKITLREQSQRKNGNCVDYIARIKQQKIWLMEYLCSSLELDVANQALVERGGEVIPLTLSETAVLATLLAKRNEICTKEELLQAGWPDRIVAGSSLLQCISLLRKKLQPYPEIELKTLARRGYQLCIQTTQQPVEEAVVLSSPPLWRKKAIRAGLLLTLFLLAAWYVGDFHRMLQSSQTWAFAPPKSLTIGAARGALQILTTGGDEPPLATNWQRHFSQERYSGQSFNQFKAFGLLNQYGHSLALCPEYHQGQCAGHGLLNITFPADQQVRLDLSDFLALTREMEQRIRYNRIDLPLAEPVAPQGDAQLVEQIYQSDIYFPSTQHSLVRTDHVLSLVFSDPEQGRLSASYCVTDQDCATSPIKYQIKGQFKRYLRQYDGRDVEIFQVKLSHNELIIPEKVSEAALMFYRELRRLSLNDEAVYFYRIHDSSKAGLWILPYLGGTLAWMPRSELVL